MPLFVIKRALLLVLLLLSTTKLMATHVVGGDITYRHITNDSFEITLTLYVDCINGNPAAIRQDTNAMVGIFDSSGTLQYGYLQYRGLPQRINSVNYNCVQPPSNACVDKYIYTYFVRLPYINGGYILAYQRCCRNNSITNIVNPGQTGATYWAYVPDTLQTKGYNSSAVFKTVPPNFLCNNRDFIYDHSATDADGDSLAYELYTPYIGGDQVNSLPRPPSNPPYYGVVWQSPYDVNNMMNGLPELAINPKTGLLTVKPRNVGQYVVGILTKEYRNGQLINLSRRDFQFNVLLCQFNLVTSFTNNIKTCSDTVTFVNKSIGATDYLWDFGIANSTIDTSTLKEPTFIFPRPGSYAVKLKIGNANCTDSTTAIVNILSDTIRFAGNDTVLCKGSSIVLGVFDTTQYKYTWRPSLFLNDSTLAQPRSTPTQNIQYIATRKSEYCTNTDTINIKVNEVKAYFTTKLESNCADATLYIDSIRSYKYLDWFLNNSAVELKNMQGRKFSFYTPYTIQLVASDSFCSDTLAKNFIPTQTDSVTLIPNVFTPNGDNQNDCFQILGIQLGNECTSLVIFNRWGHVMFDSSKDGICWDGTYAGSKSLPGVYFYILKYRDKDYHGTITLLD